MTPGEIEQLSLLKSSTALYTQGYSFGVTFELVLLKYIFTISNHWSYLGAVWYNILRICTRILITAVTIQKSTTCCCNYHLWRTCLSKVWRSHYENFASHLGFKVKTEPLEHYKKRKNLGYFSERDPHKHSDIIHFHMLSWKGEDLKFQRPIYLPPNLACLFPLLWNFCCYLLLSITAWSSSSPVFLTFTCTCRFSHSKFLQGIPALKWNRAASLQTPF